MQQLMEERNNLKKQLTNCILAKKKYGRELANDEFTYKKLRTMHMHRIIINGYETEGQKTKPIAMTAASEFAQGIPEVADARLKRDLKATDLEVAEQMIYQVKLELKILEGDIIAIRSGK